MTGRRLPARVRYTGRDDRLLRLALLEAWGELCYWCRRPLTFSTTQIDHIIPRTVKPARLAELIVLHRLPAGYDVDAPANLAPICAPCNNDKRDRDLLEAPVVHAKLRDARRHSPAVVRRVHAQGSARTVGNALFDAATADLTDPAARDEFLAFAPDIVRTLARLDESRIDYVTHRTLDLRHGHGSLPVTLTLDAPGRTWYAWVEQICGRPWPGLLQDGVDRVLTHAAEAIERAFREQCGDTAGLISEDTLNLTVDLRITDARRDAHRMICQMNGQLELETSGMAEDAQPPDYEIFDMEVGAYISTQFRLTISWDLTVDLPVPPVTDLTVTDDYVNVGIDRRLK